jgi:hypothetical protein
VQHWDTIVWTPASVTQTAQVSWRCRACHTRAAAGVLSLMGPRPPGRGRADQVKGLPMLDETSRPTAPGRAEWPLWYAARFCAAAFLLHAGDHVRRGLGVLTPGVLWAGAAGGHQAAAPRGETGGTTGAAGAPRWADPGPGGRPALAGRSA